MRVDLSEFWLVCVRVSRVLCIFLNIFFITIIIIFVLLFVCVSLSGRQFQRAVWEEMRPARDAVW